MTRLFGGIQRVLAYALVSACAFFIGTPVFAATTVTDAYDQPSTLARSVGANHAFTFTTASAVNEGATFVFTFDADFALGALAEDDVDITDDGVDLTTAANCAGSEQASVVVAGSTVTMTICAGDGGAILSGSVVVVEMGTNASSSGLGTNRITNPSVAATYYVNLSGTFSGSASFPLPIQQDDDGDVSAIVLPSGSSGGGASGGGTSSGGTSGGTDTGDTDAGDSDTGTTDVDADTGTTDDTVSTDTGTVGDESATGDGVTTGGTADSSTGGSTTDGSSGGSSTGSTSGSNGSGNTGGSSSASTSGSGASTSTEDAVDTDSSSDAPTVTTVVRVITDNGVELSPHDGDTYDVLAGTNTTVEVEVTTSATIEEVRVDVDGVEYVLSPLGDGSYSGIVRVPSVDSIIDVVVDTVEAPTTYSTYFVDARGSGLVFENLHNSRTPVGGAVVTVYQVVDGARIPWDGTSNPFLVGTSGNFSFYVPNGAYVVTAAKSGYDDASTGEITVDNNILAPSIELTKTLEPPISRVEEPTTSSAPLTAVGSVAAAVTTAVMSAVETFTAIVATPEVQTAADIAKPATAVLAATSVVVLASSFNLIPFLQYLFTAPVLFVARRKRKAFGVVYNAATKLPIDLAIIRLFSMPEHRLIRSVVTDAKGKYLLTAAPGVYMLEATKQGLAFPSQLLQGVKDDGTYLDVYTGQSIEVTEKEATIAANVPLDPSAESVQQHSPRAAALRRFLRILQHVIAILGMVLAFAALVIAPSIFAAIMFVVQLGVYLLARRLTKPRRAKGWGIVYDVGTRLPVGNAVVRLFEPTYNKLIETTITDRLGRYAFLVGPSEYYVTYSKPGYAEKIVRPIDYRKNTEPTALALDVPIEEHQEGV